MHVQAFGNKASLYFETARHLRASQVFYSLLRPVLVKRKPYGKESNIAGRKIRIPAEIFIPELDEDPAFLSRFNYEEIAQGRMSFLHETHDVDFNKWTAEASPLWNYNLNYFEFGIYLAYNWKTTREDKYYTTFKELVHSWIAHTDEAHISWQPYPISLRVINWLVCLVMFDDKITGDAIFFEEMIRSLYLQYRTLILRQEKWLLGNHYFENLFTILTGAYVFGEEKTYSRFRKKMERETKNQILDDGMHYELSGMYHKVILADLIRLYRISIGSDVSLGKWVETIISRMKNALLIFETGFDKTPLFNDSGDNVSRSGQAVLGAVNGIDLPPDISLQLDKAGYYKLSNDNVTVLIDAGIIGPPFMPGHGHCDCLSFEMAIDGIKVFCNSGTYQYQGKLRDYFRSTKAHNTVVMDNHEQSQCWGEHRVAKRIRNVKAVCRDSQFEGEYTNFCGQIHRRKITLFNEKLRVLDSCENAVKCSGYLHVVSSCHVDDQLDIICGRTVLAKITPIGSNVYIHRDNELTNYSPEFGLLQKGTCIEFRWENNGEPHGYEIEYFTRKKDR